MADNASPTKAELIERLRASREAVVEKVKAVSEQDLAAGRYENGWNGRQILAHIASIEWTYPRLIDVAREAGAAPATANPASSAAAPEVRRTSPEESSGTPTRTMSGGVNGYNDRQVEKRADASVAELIAEFEKNRAATIAAVEAVDEALLDKQIRSAGGITGSLAGVINAVAVEHVLGHAGDIAGEKLTAQRW